MRRSWHKALNVLVLIGIVLSPVSEPLARARSGWSAPVEAAPEQGPGDVPISGPSAHLNSEPGLVKRTDGQPPAPPRPMPPRIQATGVYTPHVVPADPFSSLVAWEVVPRPQPEAMALHIRAALQELAEADPRSGVAAYTPPIAPEIETLAEGLDDDPQLIYEYVHNHYDYTPVWGLRQSPQDTYLSRIGSACDLSALLLALLQAAGYEAEFVFGEVEILLDQVKNWVGIQDTQALDDAMFWYGGIPGRIDGNVVRMDHVWVRVRVAGQWHPLDPSFKTYRYTSGIDLAEVMDYDRAAFLEAAKSGAGITNNYVRDINRAEIDSQFTRYATNLLDYLRVNAPFAYVEDVVGGREIVAISVTELPTSEPYDVVESMGESATMPDDMVYKWHFELAGIDFTAHFPDIIGQRVTLFYDGATQADRDRIADAGSIFDVYPAHQVRMKAHLAVGGQEVGVGDAAMLGAEQSVKFSIISTVLDENGDPYTFPYQYESGKLRVGEWYAFPFSAPRVSPAALRHQNQLLTENIASGAADDSELVLGQSLHLLGLSWQNQVEAAEDLEIQVAQVVPVRLWIAIIMSQDVRVETQPIGGSVRPLRVRPASYTIDVTSPGIQFVAADGDADRLRALTTHWLLRASAAEGAIYEQLQDVPAVSMARLLHVANAAGLKIYHLTRDNLNGILPLLDFPDVFKSALLRPTVEAGREVFVPEAPVSVDDWYGTGWMAYDPASGNLSSSITGGIGLAEEEGGDPTAWTRATSGGTGAEAGPLVPGQLQQNLTYGTAVGTYCNTDCGNGSGQRTGGDPVDTGTGAFLHSSLDLAFGALGYPITFSRRYMGERSLIEGPVGFGWTHSYNMRLHESSDWARGFGFRGPADAAPAIVEFFVGIDTGVAAANQGFHEAAVIGCEDADWTSVQVTGNVVTATGPDGLYYEYLRLSNGSFRSHQTDNSTLIEHADGTYTVQTKADARFSFDSEGRVTALSDADGNQTTMTYDAAGNLIRVTDAVGRSIQLAYADSRLVEVTDPANRSLHYEYDADSNLIRYTDARGGTTTYAYDDEHRITSITDPEGVTFVANAYDDSGRVVIQTNGRGGTTTLRYGDGRSTVTDPLGYSTVYFFDAYQRLIGTTDALGYTTATSYDAQGHIVSLTDRNGGINRLAYDAHGNVTQKTDPPGNVTVYTYDDADNLTTITDALGHATRFTYDPNHHMVAATDPLGQSVAVAYDQKGQPTQVTDRTGATTTFGYDARGNLKRVTDALGYATETIHDILGRPLTATDANGHTQQMVYDADDNITRVTDAMGHSWTNVYDGNGSLVRTTDSAGHTTQLEYDAQFNLVAVTDALGYTTRYTYNPNDTLVSVTDANNHTTTYERDAVGRATQMTDPLGRVTEFHYDGTGNLVRQIKPDGATIDSTYDAEDRLTRVSYPDGGATSYAYNAVGRLISAATDDWSATYNYDALGRLTQTDHAGWGRSARHSYDPEGRLLSLTILGGAAPVYQVEFERDAVGRATSATDGLSGATAAYVYDPPGNLTDVVYSNGATSHYTYNPVNWVTTVEHRRGDAGLLSALAYTYDAVGNPTQIVESLPSGSIARSYAYDAHDQLTREVHPRYEIAYTYDPAGNRVRASTPLGATTYTYDAADQLVRAEAGGLITQFTYNPSGNQTSRTDCRGTTTYAYNAADQLSAATLPSGDAYTYDHDAFGLRIRTAGPDGAQRYLYDSFRPVLDEVEGGGATTAYMYGEPLLAISRDSPSGAVAFYHGDAQGNVRNLTGVNGQPVAAYNYDAYGWPGRPAGASGGASPRFVGQWGVLSEMADPGQYRMGWRTYDAGAGRFLTADPIPGPISQPLATAPYTYATNNPLTRVDPDGLRNRKTKLVAGFGFCAAGTYCVCTAAAVLSAPFVIGVGGICVGGYLIYDNWSPKKQTAQQQPDPIADVPTDPLQKIDEPPQKSPNSVIGVLKHKGQQAYQGLQQGMTNLTGQGLGGQQLEEIGLGRKSMFQDPSAFQQNTQDVNQSMNPPKGNADF